MPRRLSLSERLRLLIGKAFHLAFLFRDLLLRYLREERLVVHITDNIVINGRADAVKVNSDGTAIVIERKSSKAPKRGAWVGDVMQASAYALAISKSVGVQDVTIEIRYPSASRRFKFNSELSSILMRALDDYILVKEHGIVPAAKRGKRCSSCPYRDVCFKMDDLDNTYLLEEPGSWLIGLDVVEPKGP